MIIILAWAVTLSVASYGCMKANDWQAAETDGTGFAKKLDPAATVSCAHLDSDSNGYCSCTAFVKGKALALECGCPRTDWAATFSCDAGYKLRGCRMDKRVSRNIQLTDDADDSATEDQE